MVNSSPAGKDPTMVIDGGPNQTESTISDQTKEEKDKLGSHRSFNTRGIHRLRGCRSSSASWAAPPAVPRPRATQSPVENQESRHPRRGREESARGQMDRCTIDSVIRPHTTRPQSSRIGHQGGSTTQAALAEEAFRPIPVETSLLCGWGF
ncbi:hypothetical protein N7510_009430 [Penicillium lagena]|uniref:uncharacterized protein n=1 Tax=Penicillium lagena TaxID=94218 RepID=UPI00253F9134|nr:uncharacterized protein N7510_009430 [Penicillium lagena]KAJ5606649.1 hypothetical protein N7510_009430 [Penicillium lagena]